MDETQIRQVVMNLVINASEAVDPHAGVITVRTGSMKVTPEILRSAVLSETLDSSECVFIEVSDNGSGIKPDDLRRIFEPFYTTKFTGRGLGLSAVLGIVRGHRGALTVSSNLGRGTSFRVLLPPLPNAKQIKEPQLPKDTPWNGSGKVLVADDEAAIRNACRRLLTRMGFEVEVVNDGREALDRFKQNPSEFALILLDLTMPRTGGAEAFVEMKRIRPESRIVLMSGFSQDDANASVGKDVVPDAFLPKPFDNAALSGALKQALGEAKA
jgi:CheY-like chemotaxis protein